MMTWTDVEMTGIEWHTESQPKVVEHISGKKTLKVCRIAGQYGKPRSKPTEMGEDGKEIMSFKARRVNHGKSRKSMSLDMNRQTQRQNYPT